MSRVLHSPVKQNSVPELSKPDLSWVIVGHHITNFLTN
jgi:hypothetical protein